MFNVRSWFRSTPTAEAANGKPPRQEEQMEVKTSKATIVLKPPFSNVKGENQPRAEEETQVKKTQLSKSKTPNVECEKEHQLRVEEQTQSNQCQSSVRLWSVGDKVEEKDQTKAEEQKQTTTIEPSIGKRPIFGNLERRNQVKADADKPTQSSDLNKAVHSNLLEFEKEYQSKAGGEKQAKNNERRKTKPESVKNCQKERQPKSAEQKQTINRQPSQHLSQSSQPKAETQIETKRRYTTENLRTKLRGLEKEDQPKAKEPKPTTKVLSCMEEVEKAEIELRQGRNTKSFKNMQYNRIRKSKPTAEYKILILGSTGVGKSTFINGFANYLKYTTLSEALKSKPEYPIPSIFNVCNEKYEDIEITMGEWKGPAPKFGESVTQECCGYDFEIPMGKVTLIDTPGTDDTKGLDQDKINCEKIIEYLRNYEHLSAVCIMLQANCSRENAAFEFCLKQLFSRLPKSFAANICFVFTHAQTATVPWEIGSTGSAIENFKKKVRDMSGVVIPFGQNCFSVDNEGLRMVAQYHSGQRNFKQRKSVYIESWTRSEEQCSNLVEYISRLTPQPLKDIIFLNKALKVINVLNEGILDVNAKTQELEWIASASSKAVNELLVCQEYKERKRFTIATERIRRPLELPRFVCQEENCPILLSLGHLPKLAKDSCHSDRFSKNGQCNVCGCYYEKHEHVSYEIIEPGDRIEDASVSAPMAAYVAAIDYLNQDLNSYKKTLDKMQACGGTLKAAAVSFAKFMKETPIIVNQEGVSEPMVASLLQSPGCPRKVTMSDLETTLEALFALPSEIGMKLKTSIGNLLMITDAASWK